MTEKDHEDSEGEIRLGFRTLAAVFLGAVFMLTAFQALQLSELSKEVAGQRTVIAQLSGTGAAQAGQALQTGTSGQQANSPARGVAPQGAQGVPDMVGGC